MSHVVLFLCHVHTYCFIRLKWILYFMHSQKKKMFWMSIVLFVVFSAPVHATPACQIPNFQDNNGKCQPCPSHCKTCVSGTNCTECEDNYWGLTCQTLCTQPCPEHCHKEYGYCTYGCRDGTFVQQDLANCTNCTSNCEICSSATECFRCKPRFYGPDCRSCPKTCVGNRCNMSTGACFACREGYFRKDGICQKCPDGCANCNDITVVYSLSTIDVQCFPVSPGWRVTAIILIIVSGLLVLMLIKISYMYRIASRMPKVESRAVECSARGSSSNDVVNGTACRHPQPLEESRNVNQHAFSHLVIRRDSMHDHAAPVDDASQLEVRVDVVEGTDDPFYDHVALADNARQWMIGVDSNEGTADSLHDISQQFPAKARDIPDNDTFLADGHEKAEGQAIYTECE